MDNWDTRDGDRPRAAKGGALGELPWRSRARMKAKALWDLCPHGVQGLLAWIALAPLLWAGIAAMGRLGAGGQVYALKWSDPSDIFLMVAPALLLAWLMLPAARGIMALRRGGLLAEYRAAILGSGPSGKKEKASAGEWALWCWGWVLAAGATWLAERSLRTHGLTMGGEAAWLLLSAARVELGLAVLATCVAAGLSKAGAFGAPKAPTQAGAGVSSELAAVDWGRAKRGALHARLAAGQWAQGWAASERARWDAGRAKEKGWLGAWEAWWDRAPFALRALSMASVATLVWAVATNFAREAWDPSWMVDLSTRITFGRGALMVVLAALLARLFSRPAGQAKGAGLWFGSKGPSMTAWLGFAGAGFAIDRVGSFMVLWDGMCALPQFAGGGFFAAVALWLLAVWGVEGMGWAGGVFDAWAKAAEGKGGWRPWAIARVAWEEAGKGWAAAQNARVQLAQAVESKALENAPELAKAQRKELEEAIAEAPKRSRGPNRL